MVAPYMILTYNTAMLIYDLDLSDLTQLLKEWNEPAYRAKQIWQGLYQHFYDTPEKFTNLPKSLREKMIPLFDSPIKPKLFLDSSDGQRRKTLFELRDGQVIEAVLMKYDPDTFTGRGRRTLCISTQAGCAMGCVFCASGLLGLKRRDHDHDHIDRRDPRDSTTTAGSTRGGTTRVTDGRL